ncbi:hypothetical protein KAR91_42380, partial [Candidatus Pacearchaeota archaeon]|nr:hypothetical protein [Candidatus Pacearchaeota archaeon]
MDGPDKPGRQKQISTQLEVQKRHLSDLEDTSTTLQERLCPASRQQEPQAEGKDKQENLVPMAEELREHNNRIRAVLSCLGGMVDRL